MWYNEHLLLAINIPALALTAVIQSVFWDREASNLKNQLKYLLHPDRETNNLTSPSHSLPSLKNRNVPLWWGAAKIAPNHHCLPISIPLGNASCPLTVAWT